MAVPVGSLKQKVTIHAPAAAIYNTLLDSAEHSKLISADAKVKPYEGAPFSMWGGAISGRNLVLKPNKTIIQSWRCDMERWPREHFSELKIDLAPAGPGTTLTLTQIDVPRSCIVDIKAGWEQNYWTPMKRMLEPKTPPKVRVRVVREPTPATAPAARAKPKKAAAKKAAKR